MRYSIPIGTAATCASATNENAVVRSYFFPQVTLAAAATLKAKCENCSSSDLRDASWTSALVAVLKFCRQRNLRLASFAVAGRPTPCGAKCLNELKIIYFCSGIMQPRNSNQCLI